jgi:hypothetical protein
MAFYDDNELFIHYSFNPDFTKCKTDNVVSKNGIMNAENFDNAYDNSFELYRVFLKLEW